MKRFKLKINILGTEYKIFTATTSDDEKLKTCDGYIAPESKIITLDQNNKPIHQEHVLRHELVHAFLYESGLDVETWASNEEIVDWIALQIFKISSVSKDCLKKLKEAEQNG